MIDSHLIGYDLYSPLSPGYPKPRKEKNILEKRLGKGYDRFYNQVLLKAVKELLSEQQIGKDDLNDISKGKNIPIKIKPLFPNTMSSFQGGEFYEVTLDINKMKPKVFVKIFPDKKTYRNSKSVQNVVYHLSQNVPVPAYSDDRLKLIATPFIEGESLFDEINKSDCTPASKKVKLEQAVDLLAKIHIKGNREKFSKMKLAEIKDTSYSFLNKFFFASNEDIKRRNTNFLGKTSVADKDLESILKKYKESVGTVLDDPTTNRLIHGDAHLRNFIDSAGEQYLIDFDLARLGKIQTDLTKLFEKSGLLTDDKLKQHLVNRTYETLNEELGIDRQQFMRTYDLTEMHEMFLSAGRYFALSMDDNIVTGFKQKKNLKDIACVYYTRALGKMADLGLEDLASDIGKFVDKQYTGSLHKLSKSEMKGISHTPDDSMWSTILSTGSLNEIDLYLKTKKNLKRKEMFRTVKRWSKVSGFLMGAALAIYAGVKMDSFKGDVNTWQDQAFEQMRSLETFIESNKDSFRSVILYNDDIYNSLLKNQPSIYALLYKNKNSTIVSDSVLEDMLDKKEKLHESSLGGWVLSRERTDKDAFSSLIYATILKSKERDELVKKGRMGLTLLSKDDVRMTTLKVDDSDVAKRLKEESQMNLIFAARVLNYHIMHNKGEIYNALAAYFIGQDAVNKAQVLSESKDINQFFEYLPDAPERQLLLRAMAFHQVLKFDKHNDFVVNSKKYAGFNKLVDRDRLLWEYKHKTYLGEKMPSGHDVIKTEGYKKFLDKYHNKELALVACYDESLLEKAIDLASKGPVDNVMHFIPVSIQREVNSALEKYTDYWAYPQYF